jgi:hypothetical protein
MVPGGYSQIVSVGSHGALAAAGTAAIIYIEDDNKKAKRADD